MGYPTNINNVETLANVPWIIKNGSKAFKSFGTDKSTGTKVFALTGKIKKRGSRRGSHGHAFKGCHL